MKNESTKSVIASEGIYLANNIRVNPAFSHKMIDEWLLTYLHNGLVKISAKSHVSDLLTLPHPLCENILSQSQGSYIICSMKNSP